MKRPNWKAWFERELECRELCYYEKANPDDDVLTHVFYIGFKGSSIKDIDERGAVLYYDTYDGLLKYSCKFLYRTDVIMV